MQRQVIAFLEGFYSLVPEELVATFDEAEMELLICGAIAVHLARAVGLSLSVTGLPDLDLDDLRRNTSYEGSFKQDTLLIVWFWDAIASFPLVAQVGNERAFVESVNPLGDRQGCCSL